VSAERERVLAEKDKKHNCFRGILADDGFAPDGFI
jgi:hypothetical protein